MAALAPGRVDEAAWEGLRRELPGVPERTLRGVLRESGRELTPWVEGVRQETLEELDRTLCALAGEYEAGDGARRKALRGLVITAKTHADLAARRVKGGVERRALKEEMALRIRAWLWNPGVYGAWARLRAGRGAGYQGSGSSRTEMN